MKKIVTVLGARPQFIKAFPVSPALKAKEIEEVLVHTGQHFDPDMSEVFFNQLGIPAPKYNLGLGGLSHGAMTGQMLEQIEKILIEEKPDALIIYGDTNSTIAGALAAAKIHIPVIHVEAGLRSYNKRMPEEVNRILTDHMSAMMLCSSEEGSVNLKNEGITEGVHVIGDVMADAVLQASAIVKQKGITVDVDSKEDYVLMTLHRAENTDVVERLEGIISGVNQLDRRVLLLMHPRTKKVMANHGLSFGDHVKVMEPQGDLQMIGASTILSDSGGMQKEAYWLGKRCVTMRDETEWVETLEGGANVLVGASSDKIVAAMTDSTPISFKENLYGDGKASAKLATLVAELLN